jgi:hypothetical protein
VQSLVEATLYRGFIAGEFRESVRLVGIPDKGLAKRGGLPIPHCLHLFCLGEGLLVLLFVRDSYSKFYYYGLRSLDYVLIWVVGVFVMFVGAHLASCPSGQLSVELPGEDAGFYPAKAVEPLVGGDNSLCEQALQIAFGLQFGPQVLAQLF